MIGPMKSPAKLVWVVVVWLLILCNREVRNGPGARPGSRLGLRFDRWPNVLLGDHGAIEDGVNDVCAHFMLVPLPPPSKAHLLWFRTQCFFFSRL